MGPFTAEYLTGNAVPREYEDLEAAETSEGGREAAGQGIADWTAKRRGVNREGVDGRVTVPSASHFPSQLETAKMTASSLRE
ncbi:hypothetical protein NL676_024662 [Syzygium grande]|nr:hypothetical protein NL676_024662 [Syzygium grande]